LDGIVGLIEFVAKTIALVVAFAFWAVVGFFIWARLVVISFVLFTAQVMLSPFSGEKGAHAARRFRNALRLWPEGFGTIVNTIRGVDAAPEDELRGNALDDEGVPRARGFWGSVGSFFWQSALAVVFWAPLALFAHFTGILEISPLTSVQNRVAAWVDTSAAAPRPRAAEAEQDATDQSPQCLGQTAVQEVSPPEHWVTRRDVNVRRGPGTEHQRLDRLRGGQEVRVIGRSPTGQWSLIEIDGELRCFVSSEYLVRP